MTSLIKSLLVKLFGNASPGTLARTACLFLSFINLILVSTGHSVLPIKNEDLETFVTVGFTIASGVVAWWKNNSFTLNAVAADEYKKTLEEK